MQIFKANVTEDIFCTAYIEIGEAQKSNLTLKNSTVKIYYILISNTYQTNDYLTILTDSSRIIVLSILYTKILTPGKILSLFNQCNEFI